MDGLLRPDRVPSTGLEAYKQVIAPVKFTLEDAESGELKIESRYQFRTMEHVVLIWEVVHDEEVVCAGKVEALELEPEKTGKITLPYKVEEILPETDYYLNLSLVYKEANQYAEAGMEIAHAQFKLPYHKSGKAQH